MQIDLFHANAASVFVRLILATVIGGCIGYERKQRYQAAGIRTHMLICIGAALTMITNQYIFENITHGTDPARLGAGVISGIGFLGMGTIIITRNQKVRGLTTAAGVWTTACLGLIIGIGFYSGGIIGGIIVSIVISQVRRLDDKIKNNTKTLYIYVELNGLDGLPQIKELFLEKGIEIEDMDISRINTESGNSIGINLTIHLAKEHNHIEIIKEIAKLTSVNFTTKL